MSQCAWLSQMMWSFPACCSYKSPLVCRSAQWKPVCKGFRDSNDGESPLSVTGLQSSGKIALFFSSVANTLSKFTASLSFRKAAALAVIFSLSTLRKERMRLIHSLQMEGFYETEDDKLSSCVCLWEHMYIYTCMCVCVRGGTCIVCILFEADCQDAYLKIKPGLLRLQCKSAHCGSQSGSPESGSCVQFCYLRAGCP